MERAAVLAEGSHVTADLIRSLLPADAERPPRDLNLERSVDEVERDTILRALAESGNNKSRAAVLLGIGERTLFSKLKKYGL
jgi:DNA-binding NtrC family response regulator